MAPLHLLSLLLLLPATAASAEAEAVLLPPLEPATLDVRANVMRMLDEGRRQPAAAAADERGPVPPPAPATAMPADYPAELPAGSVPTVDVRSNVMQMLKDDGPDAGVPPPARPEARPAPQAVRARRPAEQRPDWFEGTMRIVPPPDEEERRGDYVPVPHKTITVNSLEDLKLLQEEFAAGRERKAAERGGR